MPGFSAPQVPLPCPEDELDRLTKKLVQDMQNPPPGEYFGEGRGLWEGTLGGGGAMPGSSPSLPPPLQGAAGAVGGQCRGQGLAWLPWAASSMPPALSACPAAGPYVASSSMPWTGAHTARPATR